MTRAWMLLATLVPLTASAQDTVRFTPKVAQPTFAVREPVLRVRPGTVLVSQTNFGPYYTEAGGAFPGEVGPIYVEGATTKDMLKIEIVKVRPNHALAASQVYSDFGGLATDARVRMLNDPIAAPALRLAPRHDADGRRHRDAQEPGRSHGDRPQADARACGRRARAARRRSPASGRGTSAATWTRPSCGRAPPCSSRSSMTARTSISATATRVRAQGEVAGTGLETSMDVVLKIDVVKGKQIDWPRLVDAEHIMVAGSGRPLIDAFRLAHVELIEWLEAEYGFDRTDAYTLLGQVGESSVANIVDPAYTVVAKIAKRYLPKPGRQ